MSSKIKGIEIEAFRAYETKQKFNFMHDESSEVADIIVLYAPNGYGKTSFFDAVEWGVTGEINRLKSTKPIIEDANEEKGYILKNKESELKQGSIKIVSENGSVFERCTTEIVGNRKNDNTEGKIKSVSEDLKDLLMEEKSFDFFSIFLF